MTPQQRLLISVHVRRATEQLLLAQNVSRRFGNESNGYCFTTRIDDELNSLVDLIKQLTKKPKEQINED